jgi:hypothetical protein
MATGRAPFGGSDLLSVLRALACEEPIPVRTLNPQVPNVNVETNSANKPYNHLVILQVRRRLAEGLAAQVSYTWQRNISGSRLDFHQPLLYLEQNTVPHAIQALWSYDIPVGRGKRYGANMAAWEDAIIGGWTFSGTARFQTQSFVIRNAQLVGMSVADAQKALGTIRFVTDPNSGAVTVYNFPEDIYNNTRLAYSTNVAFVGGYAPGTEPNGTSATLGPDGKTYRYFAPASSPSSGGGPMGGGGRGSGGSRHHPACRCDEPASLGHHPSLTRDELMVGAFGDPIPGTY